jgi:hypothetical protein
MHALSEHEQMVARISEAFAKRELVVQTRGNDMPYGFKGGEAIYWPDGSFSLAAFSTPCLLQ